MNEMGATDREAALRSLRMADNFSAELTLGEGRRKPRQAVGARFAEDRVWLTVMAAITVVELAWWTVSWTSGAAPAPFLLTYLVLACIGLGAAFLLGMVIQPGAPRAGWASLVSGTLLVGLGASLFLPLKYAIPFVVPFWLDAPLARAERAIFAGDPWLLLDRLLGWAIVPMDRLYALWLPTQCLVLFTVMLQPPSAAKSRALIAYALTWFLLGVAAAAVFSSAGPIFYDRLFGGTEFAPLGETLRHRGAWVVLAESDRMYSSFALRQPGMVSGMSAVPSVHVAISVWIFLASRTMAPSLSRYALLYAILIAVGSVQLGWHYVTDGMLGAVGAVVIWRLSKPLERSLESRLD